METSLVPGGVVNTSLFTEVFVITEILFGDFTSNQVLNIWSKKNNIEKKMIYLQVAKALRSIHKKGIIHNDIKPENFMAVDDALNTVKLIDFGLANKINLPLAGGTLVYAAPDYFNSGLMRPGIDIYAWAVSLAHMEFGYAKISIGTPFLILFGKHSSVSGTVISNIKDLMIGSPMFENADPTKDNLRKIVTDCLATSSASRPSDKELVTRLHGVIREEQLSFFNAQGKSAADMANGSGKTKKLILLTDSDKEDDVLPEGDSGWLKIVSVTFVLAAIAVPIGYCLFKKHNE
jgi:serine/threonine protein kinase